MNKYDNILFLGDFHSETSENYLNDFCNVYKEPTCSNKPDNPSCIDFLLTNLPRSFQNVVAEETGISDFHKMVVTVLNVFYKELKPKIIQYRMYDNFNNDLFREELNNELLNSHLNNAELSESLRLLCLYLTSMLLKNKNMYEQIMLTLWQKI